MTTTLADLRKASLAEQKEPETPLETEDDQSVGTEARDYALTHLRKSARKDVRTADDEDASETGKETGKGQEPNGGERSPAADGGAAPAAAKAADGKRRPTSGSRTSPPASPDPFVGRVREALARKTIYPSGVKATVEMPPDLSLRAKRYCLEHGNVPVRQVFLELMAAFLDEEGY